MTDCAKPPPPPPTSKSAKQADSRPFGRASQACKQGGKQAGKRRSKQASLSPGGLSCSALASEETGNPIKRTDGLTDRPTNRSNVRPTDRLTDLHLAMGSAVLIDYIVSTHTERMPNGQTERTKGCWTVIGKLSEPSARCAVQSVSEPAGGRAAGRAKKPTDTRATRQTGRQTSEQGGIHNA